MTTSEIEDAVAAVADRLARRGLFVPGRDGVSMRVPGEDQFLWIGGDQTLPAVRPLASAEGEAGLHATVYRSRGDAGAVLTTRAPWPRFLMASGLALPVLFDEQARHIGEVGVPFSAADGTDLERALRRRGSVVLCGDVCLCLGPTARRMALNAEVFEKCAQAFVVARGTGLSPSRVPWWVRLVAGRRLRRDQDRAAAALARGERPPEAAAY